MNCDKHFDANGNEIADLTIEKIPHKYVNGECTECHKTEYSAWLSYRFEGGQYCVTGMGTCADSVVIIPSVNDGKQVTKIGAYAFVGCEISEVIISFGVTSIGEGAFMGCYNLTKLTIPVSVTSIDDYAFYESGLTDIYYGGSKSQWDAISQNGSALEGIHATIHFASEN